MSDAEQMDRLFEQARLGLSPPAGAKERVLSGVMAAAAPATASVAPPSAPPASSATVTTVAAPVVKLAGALVVAATVAGAGWYMIAAPDSVTTSANPGMVPTVELPAAHPQVQREAADPGAVESAFRSDPLQAPSQTAGKSAASDTDRLAEEVALLRKAQSALRAGNAAGAMRILDSHQKKFPRGALSQERVVTRIRALCALGRMGQARAMYDRLSGGNPHSPHLASLRNSCPGLVSGRSKK